MIFMRNGQAIVEVILAFAVATIAILGLVQVATKSVANAGAAKRSAQATAYTMEGMEWVTGERATSDWQTFFNRGNPVTTYCISGLSWGTMPCGQIGSTEYSRTATLTSSGLQTMVTVSVSWVEGSRTASESQASTFTAY